MNQKKQTILFILPWLPYPLRSGGHQAIFNGVMAVKDKYNIIITYSEPSDLLFEDNKKKIIEKLGNSVQILPYKQPCKISDPIRFKTRVHRFLRRLIRKKSSEIKSPFISNYHCVAWAYEIDVLPMPYVNHVLSIINQYHVNIVQCEMISNAAFVYYLPDTITKIFVHHELGFVRQLHEQKSIIGSNEEKTAYLKFAKNKEISTLNLFDAVITLSGTDTKKLKQAGVTTLIYTSFAVVNSKPQSNVFRNTNILSFVGPSSSPPNIEAVRWFCENCWVDLLKKGDYQLQIIGYWDKNHQDEILSRYKNIRFTGFVDDLSNVIKNSIFIVPLTIGSGIRMKILEAAAIGVPIVSTTIGAEGLPMLNNIHCMIADTPEGFINNILLLNDNNLCSRLIRNAKNQIINHYTFEKFKDNRLKLYSALCSRNNNTQ